MFGHAAHFRAQEKALLEMLHDSENTNAAQKLLEHVIKLLT